MDQAIQAKIIAKTKEVIAEAEKKFNVSLGDVTIRFDIRGYRTLGMASWRSYNLRIGHGMVPGSAVLRFHPTACVKELDETLEDTIPHEVAHLVCAANPYIGKNHNRGWKTVCLALGGNGERCASSNVLAVHRPDDETTKAKRLNRRPYIYVDSKGKERRVTSVRHKKLQQKIVGKWKYWVTYRDNGARLDGGGFVRKDTVNHLAALRAKTAPAKPKARKVIRGKKVSKIQQAKQIVDAFYGKIDNADLIKQMMFGADLTEKMAKHYLRCILKSRKDV